MSKSLLSGALAIVLSGTLFTPIASAETSSPVANTNSSQFSTLSITKDLAQQQSFPFGNISPSEAVTKTSAAFNKVFGSDSNSINSSKVHLDLKMDKNNGEVATASGFIEIGNQHYKIMTDESVTPKLTTLNNGTEHEYVFDNVSVQGKNQNFPAIFGVNYIPDQNKYQVSITVGEAGYPATMVFGDLFITKDMAQKIQTQTASSSVITPMVTTDCGDDNYTFKKIAHNSTNTIDGNTTPNATVVDYVSEYYMGNGDYHLRVQGWGTPQAESYLGDSNGYSTFVSGVHFVGSAPNGGYDLVSHCPSDFNSSYSLSGLNWIAWIPEYGVYASLLANFNITLAANKNITNNWNYIEQQWLGVNQDYTIDATNQNPDGKDSYTQEFMTSGTPSGHTFQGDVKVDYQTYNPYGSYSYSYTGWTYATGTI